MLNFTVGPVMENEDVLRVGGEQTPYFRTPEFSEVMLENEHLVKEFAGAGENARVVFITGSGTASMEATVMNVLLPSDRAIVIKGGGFGARFARLCDIHGIPHDDLIPRKGESVTMEELDAFAGKGYTALLVNIDETSTGVLYDIRTLSAFCRREGLLLIVDSISSFLCDPLDMEEMGVDALITGSQKALACPPGISLVVLRERALARVRSHQVHSMYFDMNDMLKNMERGQTPFTPAVGTLLQIHERLLGIRRAGGTAAEIARIHWIAEDFRTRIRELPFEITSRSLSNAVTPLHPLTASAYDIFTVLKDEYGIWVCPNGGEERDTVFRVGHIGALTKEDNSVLIDALKDLQRRHIL